MISRSRAASALCLFAGACDGTTGLLLTIAPHFTLRLMHISVLPSEPIYMRWIGVFVFSVGCAYGLPFLSRNPSVRRQRLIGVLEITTLIRSCVALFVATAVWRGGLELAWISVFFTDAMLAILQIALLKGGALESGAP